MVCWFLKSLVPNLKDSTLLYFQKKSFTVFMLSWFVLLLIIINLKLLSFSTFIPFSRPVVQKKKKKTAYGQHLALSCVCLWFRSTYTIPWVKVNTMGVVNTICLCPYYESLPIPCVHVHTMSPWLNHESMPIPGVHVCTISLILYHDSMSIPWVFVKSMLPFLYHEKYSCQIYRNTNNKNKEI